jgi:ectoine hydroxylase-related dioxygenase (phytanoyl-CoA dioxygenase family)
MSENSQNSLVWKEFRPWAAATLVATDSRCRAHGGPEPATRPVMNTAIDPPYTLTPAQIGEFRDHGFIKLGEVLSPATLEHYGREITRLTIALNTETRPLEERGTYDRAFLQVMNLWESSALVREFVMGRRLARIAAELLEVDGVRLYHDQSLYKEPGGGITPAHADQCYWPLATDRTVTAWIPLAAVPLDKGPLAFYAGSHHESFGRDLGISDESERQISAHLQASQFELYEQPFALGDVSFHLGWTFHRAGPNRSTEPRSVMTIIYMDAEMCLKAPGNDMQKSDQAMWCPGAVVGERIETVKNPLIYASGAGAP